MKSKNVNLSQGSIGKLLLKLSIPAICAQLLNVLYNIVDRIYIGKMANGEMAMAGLGIAMPIIMLISAFSIFIGNGGAPLAAIKMGKKDNDGAEKILGNSLSLLVITSMILMIGLFVFKVPILWKFGASSKTINYANDYLTIYLLGSLFVLITSGMNPFINTQGFAKQGMCSIAIGAILNLILDPIFIFVLKMGVKGAALASILSQFIAMLWVLKFLFGKTTVLKIRKKNIKLDFKVVKAIISLGVAPFIMHGSESLILIALNSQLLKYGGDMAIGAMTIMMSLTQFIMLPLLGLTQGAQPIIGFNYGAHNFKRIRKTFKLLFISCLGYTVVFVTILLVFTKSVVQIFNTNPAFVKTTVWAIHIYFLGTFIFGAQVACQQTFLALGKAKQSMILVILRKIVILIPLIFILPLFVTNQLQGVFMAEPVTDIISTSISVISFMIFYKKNLLIVDNDNNNLVNAICE